ncbi:SDR family NAD(P)-dependent oxidoreductase [Streptomyces sp. NBC_01497]|uniref:SDR family NAD(P)-dependent oxidoreductase n=1 Tax=Streptomyces sp. NBC_01497 TaxID=2903885 RepID=UPI003FCE8897
MIEAGWGRIVNVSSIVVAHPAAMIGGNAYATTKAALEAHTTNLAAELAGTGVTANIYRPGSVDTAMQELVRTKGSGRVSEETHARFLRNHEQRMLITPQTSAVPWSHGSPRTPPARSGTPRIRSEPLPQGFVSNDTPADLSCGHRTRGAGRLPGGTQPAGAASRKSVCEARATLCRGRESAVELSHADVRPGGTARRRK